MSPRIGALATVVAVMAAAGAGVWLGEQGIVRVPFGDAPAGTPAAKSQPSGPVIYYRDPAGRPFYSLSPRKADDGRDYAPVLASEDVSFDGTKPVAEASPERKIKYYRNPMGLPDTSPVPKKDSMGMDYIAVYEGDETDDGSVKVSLGKLQRTGVETTLVGRHTITRTIKAPGVVQLDERRVAVVAPRFDGYVFGIGAATTGTSVKEGDVLATLFGQELLNQGARLVVEQSFSPQSDNKAFRPQGATYDGERIIGAERRLLNLGVPEEMIERIKRERRVPNTMDAVAPRDGVVLERNIVDGQAFKAGDVLFRIADESLVWMMADVAESDIDAVEPGQNVIVTTRARPGRKFEGKVTVVYPYLTKETRTTRVRVELANPDLALLPDMYGDVEIVTGSDESVVAIPTSAIIDSGSRRVVLAELGEGRFEPRAIKTGRRGDGYVEVVEGIEEGERVVVNGNFLIDAESNLQAALKAFAEPASAEDRP